MARCRFPDSKLEPNISVLGGRLFGIGGVVLEEREGCLGRAAGGSDVDENDVEETVGNGDVCRVAVSSVGDPKERNGSGVSVEAVEGEGTRGKEGRTAAAAEAATAPSIAPRCSPVPGTTVSSVRWLSSVVVMVAVGRVGGEESPGGACALHSVSEGEQERYSAPEDTGSKGMGVREEVVDVDGRPSLHSLARLPPLPALPFLHAAALLLDVERLFVPGSLLSFSPFPPPTRGGDGRYIPFMGVLTSLPGFFLGFPSSSSSPALSSSSSSGGRKTKPGCITSPLSYTTA